MPMKDIRVEPAPRTEPAPRVAHVTHESTPRSDVPAPAPATPSFQAERAATSAVASIRQAYAQFVVDPTSDRVQVRIVDSATNEVIREIPSDEIEKVAETMREYARAIERRRAMASQGTHG